MTTLIRRTARLLLAIEYAWHKIDEYLARNREDWKAASWSLNRALAVETLYNQLGE